MRRLLMAAVASAVLVGLPVYVLADRASAPGPPARVADEDAMSVRSGVAPDDCELPDGASTIADANLGFAWRSFRAIDQASLDAGDPTTTYSPYSAATALQMLAYGADRGIDAQLLAAMCVRDLPLGTLGQQAAELRTRLERGDEVEVANSIWTSPDFTPAPRIDTVVRDQFEGEFSKFDHYDAGPVNAWIKARTKDRIPKVLEDDDLTEIMAMLLVNAITFDGKWVTKFEEARPGPFKVDGKAIGDVPMLRDDRELEYAYSEQDPELQWADEETLRAKAPGAFHAVRIRYRGGRFAMVLVVPQLQDGLDTVLDDLGPRRWRSMRGELAPTMVALSMPKLELAEQRDIHPELFSKGVPRQTYNSLFEPKPVEPARIEFVKQATFLEVDERGTKAAAATVVGVSVSAGGPVGIPVIADHPYLLAIEEVESGELLFLSAVRDPRPAEG